MKKATMAIVVALVMTSATAEAVTVRGSRSCGRWLEYHQTGNQFGSEAVEEWFVGYLSGLALAWQKDFIIGNDNASLFAWLDNYCRSNPLNYLDDAGPTLARELIRRKGL
jgi:hypothetical protein